MVQVNFWSRLHCKLYTPCSTPLCCHVRDLHGWGMRQCPDLVKDYFNRAGPYIQSPEPSRQSYGLFLVAEIAQSECPNLDSIVNTPAWGGMITLLEVRVMDSLLLIGRHPMKLGIRWVPHEAFLCWCSTHSINSAISNFLSECSTCLRDFCAGQRKDSTEKTLKALLQAQVPYQENLRWKKIFSMTQSYNYFFICMDYSLIIFLPMRGRWWHLTSIFTMHSRFVPHFEISQPQPLITSAHVHTKLLESSIEEELDPKRWKGRDFQTELADIICEKEVR